MSVHSGIKTFGHILGKGVCRHRDNRKSCRIRIFQLPDFAGCLKSVHNRHLNIHEDDIKLSRLDVFQHIDCDFSVFGARACNAIHSQKCRNDFPVYVHVFHDKNVHACQIGIVFALCRCVLFAFRNFKFERDCKSRSFSFLALAFNFTAHQIDHFFCDGKSESCSLNRIYSAVRLAHERLVHDFDETFRHTDSLVRNLVHKFDEFFLFTRFFAQIDMNLLVIGSVFDCVGKNIDENLIDSELVRVQIFMGDVVLLKFEINVLLAYHWQHHVLKIFRHFNNRKAHRRKADVPVLDL